MTNRAHRAHHEERLSNRGRAPRPRGVATWARRLSVASILVCSAHVSAEPTDVLSEAGSVAKGEAPKATKIQAGSGTVSTQTGSFQYSYPFTVPPGRGGAQPGVALGYSSQSSLWGGIASGWSIQLPVIERYYGGRDSYQNEQWLSSMAGGRHLVSTSEPGSGQSFRAQGDSSFARYQNIGSIWKFLQTDGSILYFNEPAFIGGGFFKFDDWMPITRQIDAFGNEVRYTWEPVFAVHPTSQLSVLVEFRIDRIEYAANPSAGLAPHAFVDFNYDSAVHCNGLDSLPVGARLDYRSGNRRIFGFAPLASVTTSVTAGAGTREVRRYDLTYDLAAMSCSGSTVPRRLLSSITESATSPAGVTTQMPPVSFAYGYEAVRGATQSPTSGPDPSENFLPTGVRAGLAVGTQGDLSYDEHLLRDIDGDGRVDWLSASTGGGCRLHYYKNEGRTSAGQLDFSGPYSMYLPSIPWEQGGAQNDERCSLNGQFSRWRHQNAPPLLAPYNGVRLLYQFKDFDGDGILDLLTGLSAAEDQIGPSSFGFDIGVGCPRLAGTFVDDFDPEWDDPPEFLFGWREPVGQNRVCYGWKVYRNVRDGTGRKFELLRTFNAPFALYSEARGTPSIGDGFSGSPQSLIDLDGDGLPDFLRVRPRKRTHPPLPASWFWYRHEPEWDHLVAHTWIGSSDDRRRYYPTGTARFGGSTVYSESIYQQLADVNGDGLPDYLFNNSVGFNTGTGFAPQIDHVSASPAHLSLSNTFINSGLGTIDVSGPRYEVTRTGDYNGDGRIDIVDTTTRTLYYGLGDGNYHATSAGSAAYRQAVNNGGDGPGWHVNEDLIDLDGDGFQDHVSEALGFHVIQWTETDIAPPGVLKSVDNGRGLVLEVEYAPHTDPGVVTIAGGEQPGTLWVVSQMTARHLSGSSPDSITRYHYQKPIRTYDDASRIGFRGFESVRQTIPSGAVTETRYDYTVDWSGRESAQLSFASASANPTSISSTEWSEYTTMGAIKTVHPNWTREYVCEIEDAAGNVVTLDEAACLLEEPLLKDTGYAFLRSGGQNIAIVTETSVEIHDDLIPQLYRGKCSQQSYALLYSTNDYRFVTTKQTTRFGLVLVSLGTAGKPELGWSCSGSFGEHLETTYEPTLRAPTKTCAARSAADIDGQGNLVEATSVCALTDIDLATGNKLRKQSPQEYRQTGAWQSGVTHYEYDPIKLFVDKVINPLGHEVTTTTDLGTGVALSSHGPNPNQGAYQEIDGFGRTLHEWISIKDDPDPDQPYHYRRKRDVTYNDAGSPATMTERQTRLLSTEGEVEINSNSMWAEITTTFDGAGRVISVYEAALGVPLEVPSTRTFTYDAAGNLVSLAQPDPSKAKYQAGDVTYSFVYDSLGRRTCSLAPNGSGVATLYAGRQITTIEFGSDGGSCSTPTDPSAESPRSATRAQADIFGRVTTVKERLDAVANTWSTTRYEYDANSNLSRITREDPDNGDIITDLTHDLLGNRVQIDRHGRTWSYTYDDNGNMLTELSPVPEGSPPADADKYLVSVLYDELNRPLSRIAGDGSLEPDELEQLAIGETTYEYDSGLSGLGSLTRKITPLEVIDFSYDARGNPATTTRSIDLSAAGIGVPLQDSLSLTNLSWNAFGQPASVIRPSGQETHTHYHRWPSAPRHVYLFTDDGLNEYFLNSRNAAGRVVTTRHLKSEPGVATHFGRQETFGYDQLGRPTLAASSDAGDDKISQTMSYYGTSEVATLISQVGPVSGTRSFSFTYDDQHQLVDAFDDTQYHGSFSYTPTGRLLGAYVTADVMASGTMVEPRDVSYVYDDDDPEIVTALLDNPTVPAGLSVDYDYDAAGNMVTRSVTGGSGAAASVTVGLVYDAENRLRIRRLPDGTEERYFYDGANRWLAVQIGTSGTATGARLWFADDEIEYVCTALECQRKTEKSYIRLGDRTVARVDHDVATGSRDRKIVHSSGLGHTLGIYSYSFDGSLNYNLKVGFQYGPFGEILSTYEASGADSGNYLERFNGKELDPASGLSYYGHRYFDPLALIWNRSDPKYRFLPEAAFTDPRRANLYSFTANNPIRYKDPDGLDQYDRTKPIGKGDLATIGAAQRRERAEACAKDPCKCGCTDGGHPDAANPVNGGHVEVSNESLVLAAVTITNPWIGAGLISAAIFASKGPAGGSEMAIAAVSASFVANSRAAPLEAGKGAARGRGDGVGAMRALEFEPNPKHASVAHGKASAAPTNGQAALNSSIPAGGNSSRRVGIDYDTSEFVVFPEHLPGRFHGYVVPWNKLTQRMQSALREAGMANKKGRILTD